MSEDAAQSNFMMNTLREGGGSGGGAGTNFNVSGLLTDQGVGMENTEQKFTNPDVFSYTVGKLLQGMQGQMQALDMSSVSNGLSPPSTPMSAKIGGLMSSKG